MFSRRLNRTIGRCFSSKSKFWTRYDHMYTELQMKEGKRQQVFQAGELMGGGSVKWVNGNPSGSASFCRQCPATGLWVIYAPVTTSGKPYTHKAPTQLNATHNRPEHDPNCPFCPGNEHMCPSELYEERNFEGDWEVRVLPNKFPFLMENESEIECGFWGEHYPQVTAAGVQEVVVSTNKHNVPPAYMTLDELYQGLRILSQRGLKAAVDPRVRFVALFENHGIRSGGSIEHPHFQVVGLPIIPTSALQRFEHAHRFHEMFCECVFCNMIKNEEKDLEGDGSRIVAANDDFICFVPYAASRSFQMWIVPRRHSPSFFSCTPAELRSLTEITSKALKGLYGSLADPDYNLIVRQAPPSLSELNLDQASGGSGQNVLFEEWLRDTEQRTPWFQTSYHWHLDLIPHISTWGGVSCFDVVVHKLLPETQAQILREAMEKQEVVVQAYHEEQKQKKLKSRKENLPEWGYDF